MVSLLRLGPTIKATQRSRSAIYKDIERGLFTHPIKIGLRAVAWPEAEVHAIKAARLSGMSDNDIINLVSELESLRNIGKSKAELLEIVKKAYAEN